MQIIVVSKRLAQAKVYTTRHILSVILAVFMLVAVLLTLLMAPLNTSSIQRSTKALLPSTLNFAFLSQKQLDAYAKQLGEMQARLLVLESRSQYISQLSGNAHSPKRPTVWPMPRDGRGGPLLLPTSWSDIELQNRISAFNLKLGQYETHLDTLENTLLEKSVLKNLSPDIFPVDASYNSSSFGWRIDPFTGQKAFHEGLDFLAAEGTPIVAVAGGIVSISGRYTEYGNMVEITHGGGLATRYAHASRLAVRVGQRVSKGQKIAEVGNTGRSTGAHLHYEIRLNSVALDPKKYLSSPVLHYTAS